MGNNEVVTVPAAALAMGVSRIVLERAIKAKALTVHTFHNGGKNPGFRLIPVTSLKDWLKGRKGYHEALKNGATQFHPWGARRNPEVIVSKALTITNTNKAA
jgi:hypothetical protein